MNNPGCKGKAETQPSRSLWIRKRDILDMSTMGSSNKQTVGTQTQRVHCVPGKYQLKQRYTEKQTSSKIIYRETWTHLTSPFFLKFMSN